MKKLVFLGLFFGVILARENPFEAVVKLDNPSPKKNYANFERKEFVFGDDARILNKILLSYTSVNGAKKMLEIPIENAIDWHKTYVLIDANLEKTPQIEEKTLDEDEELKQKINDSTPKEEQEIPWQKYFLAPDFYAKLYKNEIILETDTKIVRNFTLKNPERLVIDFASIAGAKFEIYELKNDFINGIFTGVHSGFFRVVLRLDGMYDYDIIKNKNSYYIKLK